MALPNHIKDFFMHSTRLRIKPVLEKNSQTVSFAIAIGTSRQVCSLRTRHESHSRALTYFQHNRALIEKMARDRLQAGSLEDGEIKLEML